MLCDVDGEEDFWALVAEEVPGSDGCWSGGDSDDAGYAVGDGGGGGLK